jgi:oligopeptide/dipeptide ABC transporter ATP-binding protein
MPGFVSPSLSPGTRDDGNIAAAPVTAPLLRVRGLSKHFPIFSGGFRRKQVGLVRAVDDVHFDLMPGETLGVVGESGSGKTTLARCILRALTPTAGAIEFRHGARTVDLAQLGERELRVMRPHMQMIFQDPFSSLDPRMTVGEIVAEPLVIHRMARGTELTDRVEHMLAKVGLKAEHRQRYPHAFSGGQRQRIGIARALIMNPSLIVADEAVSALDVSVQAQVINLFQDLQREFMLTTIFVAHDLSVVKHLCDRVAVMYAGKLVEIAPAEQLFAAPKHPYTQTLLSAMPSTDPNRKMNFDVLGEVADPGKLPGGCSFHPRCGHCFAACRSIAPQLLAIDDARHLVSCHVHHAPPVDARS